MHQGAMAASPQSFNPARENRRAAALFNKPRRDNPYQPFSFDTSPLFQS
jgi:hypothetical protein